MGCNSTAPSSNSTTPTNTTSSPFPGTPGGGGSAAPLSTQKGISASCTKYGQAKKVDHCSTFAQENKTTPDILYALNNALGESGKNCDTDFWSGYYHCVSSTNASPAGGNESTGITTAQPVIETALTIASTTITTNTATCDLISTPVSGSDPAFPCHGGKPDHDGGSLPPEPCIRKERRKLRDQTWGRLSLLHWRE